MAALADPKSDFASPSAPVAAPPTGFLAPVSNIYNRLQQWRKALNLPNPGTVEGLTNEVNATHLTRHMFDGARADLVKTLSGSPLYQITHSFTMGSQQAPSSYSFGTVFANKDVILHGNVDDEGNLSGRFQQNWSANNVTKVQMQLTSRPGHSSTQIEHDYQGLDYSLNFTAVNPSPVDGSGIYVANALQSVTQNLALGAQAMVQYQPGMSAVMPVYVAKYTSTDKNWIATTQVQPPGIVQASYWQKLSPKVDVAANLHLVATSQRREALATLGVKYDLRMATFRAQLDSTGKVSALLEQRIAPAFGFLISGEIDHFQNAAKFGVGVMLESASLTPEEMGLNPDGTPLSQ